MRRTTTCARREKVGRWCLCFCGVVGGGGESCIMVGSKGSSGVLVVWVGMVGGLLGLCDVIVGVGEIVWGD